MKKLFLAILLFTIGVSAQTIQTVGDTTTLKALVWNQPVILQQFGGGTFDRTGGGIFQVMDSTYDEVGTHAFDHPWSGKQWVRLGYPGEEQSIFVNAEIATLTLGTVDAFSTTGDITIDGTASGLDLQGAYTSAAIDLTDVTLDHSGSSGPVMIRAGTYAAPVTSTDAHQSGMIRMYGRNSATVDDGTGFYDRIIFANSQITGNKSAFPISSLVEIRDVGSADGPVAAMAGQFIAHMTTAGSKLDSTASLTDGMFGAWFKVTSALSSVCDATSRVAPLWLDNVMNGTVSGEHYTIYATSSGGDNVDAFIGFETITTGWDNLFYFDETAYDQDPVSNTSLKVLLNATQYYIPMSTSNVGFTTVYPIDQTITNIVAGGDAGVNLYISQTTTALTSTLYGIKASARVNVESGSGDVTGGEFKAGNLDAGYSLNAARGIYVEVVDKIPAANVTWGTARGVEVNMDLDQGSASKTNTITDAQIFYGVYNLPTADNYATVTNGYGIFLRNEAVGGTGQMLDAGFYLDDKSHSGGIKGWDYGIDFSGIGSNSGSFGTADLKLSSGVKIFTGDAANGDAVYAEVGAKDATGSIYLTTAGAIYIQVANAGAAADWYKVTMSDAD